MRTCTFYSELVRRVCEPRCGNPIFVCSVSIVTVVLTYFASVLVNYLVYTYGQSEWLHSSELWTYGAAAGFVYVIIVICFIVIAISAWQCTSGIVRNCILKYKNDVVQVERKLSIPQPIAAPAPEQDTKHDVEQDDQHITLDAM